MVARFQTRCAFAGVLCARGARCCNCARQKRCGARRVTRCTICCPALTFTHFVLVGLWCSSGPPLAYMRNNVLERYSGAQRPGGPTPGVIRGFTRGTSTRRSRRPNPQTPSTRHGRGNNWNVSKVETMFAMFDDATSFNQPLHAPWYHEESESE